MDTHDAESEVVDDSPVCVRQRNRLMIQPRHLHTFQPINLLALHCFTIGNQKPTSPNTLLRNLRRSPCALKYEKQNTFMSHLVFAEGFDRTGKDGRLSRYNGDVYDGHVESWLHTWNCQRQRRRSIHATWKCFYNRVPLLKQTEPLPHYKSWYILTIKYLPQLTY